MYDNNQDAEPYSLFSENGTVIGVKEKQSFFFTYQPLQM